MADRPSLPVEIWRECWNHVSAPEDLSNLTRACRLFCDICQPNFFHSMTFSALLDIDAPPSEDLWVERSKEALTKFRWLSTSVRHAAMVRYLLFSSVGVKYFKPLLQHPAVWDAYRSFSPIPDSPLLGTPFCALSHITLFCIYVSVELIDVLKTFPRLSKVDFDNTEFPPIENSQRSSHLLLEHVTFEAGCELESISDSVAPFGIISHYELRTLRFSSFPRTTNILTFLSTSGACTNLTSLTIHHLDSTLNKPHSLSILFNFLLQTPNLTTLSILNSFRSLHPVPTLPSNALSKLAEVRFDDTAVASVIPTRPISSTEINWNHILHSSQTLTVLHYLSQSTAPLTCLTLPTVDYHTEFPDITKHVSCLFPHLEELTLCWGSRYPTRVEDLPSDGICAGEFRQAICDAIERPRIPIPLNASGQASLPKTTYDGFIDHLSLGTLPLPHTLRRLTLGEDYFAAHDRGATSPARRRMWVVGQVPRNLARFEEMGRRLGDLRVVVVGVVPCIVGYVRGDYGVGWTCDLGSRISV